MLVDEVVKAFGCIDYLFDNAVHQMHVMYIYKIYVSIHNHRWKLCYGYRRLFTERIKSTNNNS